MVKINFSLPLVFLWQQIEDGKRRQQKKYIMIQEIGFYSLETPNWSCIMITQVKNYHFLAFLCATFSMILAISFHTPGHLDKSHLIFLQVT